MGPSDQNLPQQAPSGPRGIPSALPLENVGGWPGAGAVGGAGAAAAAAAAGYVGYAPQPTLNAHAGPSNQAAANNAPNNQQQAENNTGSAAAPSNPSQVAAPSNSAQMTIAERLDRGLITTIQGLNQRETEQLIDWARAQRPKITWNEIHRRFRFKDFGERWAVSTLRGNRRNRTYRDDPPANGHRRRAPPRVAEITDSDVSFPLLLPLYSPSRYSRFPSQDDLILEAVETIAGGHLDNVDGKVPHRLWTRVQDHLKANGSNTTAGTARIKQRYRTLTSEVPTMDSSMRFQPLKWDHKGYEQYQVPGLEEASFHDDLEVEPEREAEVQSEPEIEDEIVVERQSEPSDQEDEEQAEDESSEDNEEDGSSDGYEYDANDDDEEEDN